MTEAKVTIYTTGSCPYCRMAKTFLQGQGVSFNEKHVEQDENAAKEMITKSRQTGVPVLDINGKIIIGFDQGAIEEALGRNETPSMVA